MKQLPQSEDVAEEAIPKAEEREGFGNKIEFLLAMIGYAVGLGNVWRFPYLAQKWGGGAFLVPYIIALVTMGLPLFFLEMAVGQRIREAPLALFYKISKPFAGLGIAAVMVSFLVGVYYTMVIAWCFYYFFISFSGVPPYARECPIDPLTNATLAECHRAGKTQYYWYRITLEATDSIAESGGLNWKLCLTLLLSWLLIYAATFKGVKSMGKVVYFTALFPYVVLIIFFIQGLTLPGSVDGIKRFKPDFSMMGEVQMWLDASTQIFYSLSLSFGGIITMSSGNDINNNCLRDAVLVACINCGTSLFAGIVIFSILGYKAHNEFSTCVNDYLKINQTCQVPDPNWKGESVKFINGTMQHFLEQSAQGPGLTFVAFTEAISTMPVPWLWSLLFFTMLLTLGMGTMMGTFVTVRNTIIDLDIIPLRGEILGGILCLISFLFGLIFCQRSGEYWLQMFDSFAGNVPLLLVGFFEVIIIAYIYGIKRFSEDIKFMLGKYPNWYWKICWMFVTPVMIAGITLYFLVDIFMKGIKYSAWSQEKAEISKSVYPAWGEAMCIILMLASIVFIPIIAVLIKLNIFKLKNVSSDTLPVFQNGHKSDVAKEDAPASTVPLRKFEMSPDRV